MGLKWGWLATPWTYCLIALIVLFYGSPALGSLDAPAAEKTQAADPSEPQSTHFRGIFNHLETEFILTGGIRRDSLDWSIAGNNTNVLSELTWESVDSYQLSLANRSRYKRHLYVRGHLSYSWIRDGRVRDSDYGADDRSDEFSRSISETNDDDLWDVSLGGGYAFYFADDRLMVAPMIGFSYNKQNFRIENGRQVISADNPYSTNPGDNPPPVGPLSSELNSTYFARWMGPWVGCDVRYRLDGQMPYRPPMELGLAIEVHWADYYGEGNWNLRDDLEHPKSFEHETTGFGVRLAGDAVIHCSDRWSVTIMAEYQDWTSEAGTDRIFTVFDGTLKTRLNEVNWSSTSILLGAVYQF